MMQTVLHWCLCVFVLLRRRARLLWRNPGQLALQSALIFGFPAIVVLFALDGLPQIRHAQLEMSRSIVAELLVTLDHLNQVTRVGALVSSITMFQVILLGLVASNNTAREIVARRNIFEKEKLAGLAPSAALCSTALWMSALCLIQTTWMFFC